MASAREESPERPEGWWRAPAPQLWSAPDGVNSAVHRGCLPPAACLVDKLGELFFTRLPQLIAEALTHLVPLLAGGALQPAVHYEAPQVQPCIALLDTVNHSLAHAYLRAEMAHDAALSGALGADAVLDEASEGCDDKSVLLLHDKTIDL